MARNEFKGRTEKIEELVRTVESVPDEAVRADALELVQSVMALHGSALQRIMEIVLESGQAGGEIIRCFAGDDLVSGLLLLHDLHPDDLETRVIRALEKVRPFLQSHHGNLEFLGIEEGRVRLRLQGSCKGCPGSAITSKTAIESAIFDSAPDVVAVEVEGIAEKPPTGQRELVQLGKVTTLVSLSPTAQKSEKEGSRI